MSPQSAQCPWLPWAHDAARAASCPGGAEGAPAQHLGRRLDVPVPYGEEKPRRAWVSQAGSPMSRDPRDHDPFPGSPSWPSREQEVRAGVARAPSCADGRTEGHGGRWPPPLGRTQAAPALQSASHPHPVAGDNQRFFSGDCGQGLTLGPGCGCERGSPGIAACAPPWSRGARPSLPTGTVRALRALVEP